MGNIDFLVLIIVIFAFIAGYIYREVKLLNDIINLNQKLHTELKKQSEEMTELGVKDITKLKHEIINGIHYFFTENEDKFVAQGLTLDDAAHHYALSQGKDIVGLFKHIELNKDYCFVDNKCMEFKNENQ